MERSCWVSGLMPSKEAYDYFGLAAHPPTQKRLLINNQQIGDEYDHGDYSHSPFLHPVVDVASARVQFGVLIWDYKIPVSTVPIFDYKTDKRRRRRASTDTDTDEENSDLEEEEDLDEDQEVEEEEEVEEEGELDDFQGGELDEFHGGELDVTQGLESDTWSDGILDDESDSQKAIYGTGISYMSTWHAEEQKRKQQRREDHESLLRDFPPGEPQWILVGMLS